MTVLFADDFNRANGPLGGSWTTDPAGNVQVYSNTAGSEQWDSRALVNIGQSAGYKVSVKINKREWPAMLFRFVDGWSGSYLIVWSNPNYELIRKIDGSDTILQTMASPATATRTMWAEVRETEAGTDITWGYDSTSLNYVDNTVGRPAGHLVGVSAHPGVYFDDFLVESLDGDPDPEPSPWELLGRLAGNRYAGVVAKTGASYTPVLADEGKLIELSHSSAITVTLPADADLAFPVGGAVDFVVTGTGLATFAPGAGATVHASPTATARAQYSKVTAIKRAADTWLVAGDLATS